MKKRIVGFILFCAVLTIAITVSRGNSPSYIEPSWSGNITGAVSVDELREAGELLEYYPVYPKEPLQLLPMTIGHSNSWQNVQTEFPDQFVTVIPNGRVGHDERVLTQDGRLVLGATHASPPYGSESMEEFLVRHHGHVVVPKAKKVEGRVLWLASSKAFYHWIVDFLPKLALIEKVGLEYDKVIVGDLKYPFQRQSLEMLGIPKEKWVEFKEDEVIEADELIVTSRPSTSFALPSWASEFLRDRFLKKGEVEAPYRRLYISRQPATERRVVNEEEVIDWLESQGFQIILAEDYSFADQAKLFAEAEIVVTPHGAALTNTIFCQPGTTVIEFHLHNWRMPRFSVMSQFMGLNHFAFLGDDPFPDSLKGKIHKGYANMTKQPIRGDISIPMYLLKQTVSTVLAKQKEA